MNIGEQLKRAQSEVGAMAIPLSRSGPLPPRWFRNHMVALVFGYLLRGREKRDGTKRDVPFRDLLQAARDEQMNLDFVQRPSKYLYDKFVAHPGHLDYVVEEYPDGGSGCKLRMTVFGKIAFSRRIRPEPDSFIRFLKEFDETVPVIHAAAEEVRLEVNRRLAAEEILRTAVGVLAREVLGSAGIRHSFKLLAGAVVFTIPLGGRTALRVRMPADSYAARIRELPHLVANPEEGMARYGNDFRYVKLKK